MHTRSILLTALLSAACASGGAYELPPPHPLPDDPNTAMAYDSVEGELPAHRFYAREHAASPPPSRPPVSLESLPAMIRSSKCVAAGAVAEGRPGPPPRRRPQHPVKPSPLATAAPTPSPGATPNPARDASTTKFAGGTDVAGEEDLAEEASGMAPERESEPMADSDQKTASEVARPSRRSKRRAERSRRKAQRAHDRVLATASQAPASPPPTAEGPAFEPTFADETPAEQVLVLEPQWPPAEEGWGGATYLSNDDTMSLSSAQRVLFAIDQHLPLPPQHVRPHELLNYFSFETAQVEPGQDFSVRGEIAPSRRSPGLLTMGINIAGRRVGREGRRNAALTLVIDRSGSMKAEGRMEYLKRGLLRMVRELDNGDILNVITFDHRVCTPLRNFVVGRDDLDVLTKTIHRIRPTGSTNLHAGLMRGYQVADASYQPGHGNRVLLISDAIANRGQTDPRTLSMVSDWYDSRRIRLSGVGVGREFNDALLDRLTEKGRGAYVFLGSEAEVDAVFGQRFTSLIETVANDVHFRLHLPPSLRVEQFHGEESSTIKAEVQAVHFFADTSQLMLADVEAWQGQLRPQDEIMVEIEYQHPETGQLQVEDHVLSLGEMSQHSHDVRKGELIMHFIDGIGRQARREAPAGWRPHPGTWRDPGAREDCAQTRAELHEMASGSGDPEVRRILGLWDGYCARFEDTGPRRPPRKEAGSDRWPGAER